MPIVVNSRYGESVFYRCPDQTIEVFHPLNGAQ